MSGDTDHEAVALVQALIRNGCVSDPEQPERGEGANLDAIAELLSHPRLVTERLETTPGRAGLLARLPGDGDPGPLVLLVAHLDVAAAEASRWRHDPFGGELIDDEVWGRGAVHAMSYLATMALAMRRLAESGLRPAGEVVFVALPDRFDHHGAGIRWLVDHRPDALAPVAVSELSGYPVPSPAGLVYPVGTSSNGVATYRLTVRERPVLVHLAAWSRTAVDHAVEVLQAIAAYRPAPFVTPLCRQMLEAAGYAAVMGPLLDPARTDETIAALPADVAPFLHAQTHATLAVVGLDTERGPSEVPGLVSVDVEVGLLPGQDIQTADALVRAALGPLVDGVDVELTGYEPSTSAPTSSRLVDAFESVVRDRDATAVVVPTLNTAPTATTTALRNHGVAAYGMGTYSGRIPAPELGMLPGNDDERLDVESITLLAALWPALVRNLRP